jgi:hypothetical protein
MSISFSTDEECALPRSKERTPRLLNLLGTFLVPRVELNRSMEMFFGKLIHAEGFQPHP